MDLYHEELEEFETISSILTGSAIQVNGILVWNEKRDQIEIEGQNIPFPRTPGYCEF